MFLYLIPRKLYLILVILILDLRSHSRAMTPLPMDPLDSLGSVVVT